MKPCASNALSQEISVLSSTVVVVNGYRADASQTMSCNHLKHHVPSSATMSVLMNKRKEDFTSLHTVIF